MWKEAQKCCEALGRTLLNLDESEKLDEIYNLINDNYQRLRGGLWTSGTNAIIPEKWIWSGNYEFVSFNNFYHNYTYFDVMSNAEDNHECLEIFAHSQEKRLLWDHEDCDIAKPFICDRSGTFDLIKLK